jgi:hypothetical protein
MLDAVTATAVEVAAAAGVAARLADLLRDLGKVDALDDLARSGRELGVLGHRVAGKSGRLLVVARGVVADDAIDVLFLREIEVGVLPAVADVAGGAGSIVGGDGDAEVVEHLLLAQDLFGVRVHELPLPVLGAVDLAGGLGVAFEAGLGDLRTGVEGLLQLLEFGVVGRRRQLDGFRLGFGFLSAGRALRQASWRSTAPVWP